LLVHAGLIIDLDEFIKKKKNIDSGKIMKPEMRREGNETGPE